MGAEDAGTFGPCKSFDLCGIPSRSCHFQNVDVLLFLISDMLLKIRSPLTVVPPPASQTKITSPNYLDVRRLGILSLKETHLVMAFRSIYSCRLGFCLRNLDPPKRCIAPKPSFLD